MVTIVIAALEALPEVVAVVCLVDVAARVPERGLAVRRRVRVIRLPVILTVGLAAAIALAIAEVHRLPQRVDAELIRFAGGAVHSESIGVWRRDVRLPRVIALIAQLRLLSRQLGRVFLLRTILGGPLLCLELGGLLLGRARLLVEMAAIVGGATLFVGNPSLLFLDCHWRMLWFVATSTTAPPVHAPSHSWR